MDATSTRDILMSNAEWGHVPRAGGQPPKSPASRSSNKRNANGSTGRRTPKLRGSAKIDSPDNLQIDSGNLQKSLSSEDSCVTAHESSASSAFHKHQDPFAIGATGIPPGLQPALIPANGLKALDMAVNRKPLHQSPIGSPTLNDDVASANVVQNQANIAKPRQLDAIGTDLAPVKVNEILQCVIEEERARATLLEAENDALREERSKLREELKILGAGELKIRRDESELLHAQYALLAIQLAKDNQTSTAIIQAREETHQAVLEKQRKEHAEALRSVTAERDQLQAQLDSVRALLGATSLECDARR